MIASMLAARSGLLPSVSSATVVAIACLSLAPDAAAQFSAESFESHRYQSGALPGADLWSGQDGWLLLESAYPPNLQAVQVQGALVRSGQQAVCFDASGLANGTFGELRRNELFSLTTGVLEIELDFLITSSANPSSWELYSQPYPHPASCYLRWWIAEDGRVEYHDTPNRNWVQTNAYVSKDVWHHARTVVDITGNRTEIHIDGLLVATGTPIGVNFNAPDHGFTQINAYDSGDDQFYFDNFTVRERTAEHGLTVDLPRLPINQRSVVDLRLAGGTSLANRNYAVLGSITGTAPGTPIGSVVLPLNYDGFFGVVVAQLGSAALPGFLGVLNADGNAYAQFDTQIPVPAQLIGLQVDFAYITMSPFDAVSEPARTVVSQ